jgi:DNA-binding transcriptional ArsR family regulator
MLRATTNSDTFSVIAEPQRRAILEAPVDEEHSVIEIVDAFGLSQPPVSKHLRMLRDVGLVPSRRDGRQMR